jgi:hypothetical protein
MTDVVLLNEIFGSCADLQFDEAGSERCLMPLVGCNIVRFNDLI